ncbi:hypothetical protein [Halostella sp. PRR32]|uniref:hypothetical protein n=1 Tax=Halostella sp. PRR32 TaxID=3098147 RepID=UPI002B1E06E0|nr:hypothetical protein [Halostella sp. PRR32]
MEDSDEAIRVWLVERNVDQRNLVTLVYATPDGRRRHLRQLSSGAIDRGTDVTAAKTVHPDDLEPVEDETTRDRYESEASRVADRHSADDTL